MSRPVCMLSALSLVTSLVVWSQPTPAEDAAAVGFVEDFDGARNDYAICEAGHDTSDCTMDAACKDTGQAGLYPFQPVYPKSCILLCRGSGQVTLLLGNGERQTVDRDAVAYARAESENACVVVKNHSTVPKGILAVVADSVARAFGRTGSNALVMARVKGDGQEGALALPMLFHRKPRMVAGTRAFSVAWIGGTAPYRVVVTRGNDGAEIIAVGDVAETSLPATEVDIEPGPYVLEITDSQGAVASAGFLAVPPGKEPALPANLVPKRFPDETRRVGEAAWFAQQENGRWMLEAYLRTMAEDVLGYPPARSLRSVLQFGEVPAP